MKRHLLVSLPAGFANSRVGESLGIRYIKSFLNINGYEVDILENQYQKYSNDELALVINNYDIIGFSINYCGQVAILKELLPLLNSDNRIIYLGGHFASICYEDLLRDFSTISFIVLTDGEFSTLELARNNFNFNSVSNVVFLNQDGELVQNPVVLIDELDDLPFPYRDSNSYYLGDNHFSVISSRGCYHNCSYCSVGSFTETYFNHRIRFRSAQNIFNELIYLHEVYNVQYITFQDDLFIGTDHRSKERAKELAELLISSNLNIFFSIQCSVKAVEYNIFALLYKAGLRNVMIGIENFSKHALKCFNKTQTTLDTEKALHCLRSIGIPISYGFIMFYPEMETAEILENIEILYAFKLISIRAITSRLQIYVGTAYCERECNSADFVRDNYTVKYYFQNKKIRDFIEQCKYFAKSYSTIESQLYHMEFLSHSNHQISSEKINSLFSEFRGCLYSFVKSKYDENFYGNYGSDTELIKNRIDELSHAVSGYSTLLGL